MPNSANAVPTKPSLDLHDVEFFMTADTRLVYNLAQSVAIEWGDCTNVKFKNGAGSTWVRTIQVGDLGLKNVIPLKIWGTDSRDDRFGQPGDKQVPFELAADAVLIDMWNGARTLKTTNNTQLHYGKARPDIDAADAATANFHVPGTAENDRKVECLRRHLTRYYHQQDAEGGGGSSSPARSPQQIKALAHKYASDRATLNRKLMAKYGSELPGGGETPEPSSSDDDV